MNKDCSICLYNGVCEGRADDETITDCCIPEAPLREVQRKWLGYINTFIEKTRAYIKFHKNRSVYWKSVMLSKAEKERDFI